MEFEEVIRMLHIDVKYPRMKRNIYEQQKAAKKVIAKWKLFNTVNKVLDRAMFYHQTISICKVN